MANCSRVLGLSISADYICLRMFPYLSDGLTSVAGGSIHECVLPLGQVETSSVASKSITSEDLHDFLFAESIAIWVRQIINAADLECWSVDLAVAYPAFARVAWKERLNHCLRLIDRVQNVSSFPRASLSGLSVPNFYNYKFASCHCDVFGLELTVLNIQDNVYEDITHVSIPGHKVNSLSTNELGKLLLPVLRPTKEEEFANNSIDKILFYSSVTRKDELCQILSCLPGVSSPYFFESADIAVGAAIAKAAACGAYREILSLRRHPFYLFLSDEYGNTSKLASQPVLPVKINAKLDQLNLSASCEKLCLYSTYDSCGSEKWDELGVIDLAAPRAFPGNKYLSIDLDSWGNLVAFELVNLEVTSEQVANEEIVYKEVDEWSLVGKGLSAGIEYGLGAVKNLAQGYKKTRVKKSRDKLASELLEIKQLYDRKIITESEYKLIRGKLLKQMMEI